MAYIPDIIDYKPFYIQTDADEAALDTTLWGMVAKSNPFPVLPNPKDVYSNTWLDEDGDDEYNAQMHYNAIEFDVTFYIKTKGVDSESALISQIDSFFAKVRHGEFKVYDSYTGIGRQKVRYAGYDEDEYKRNKKSGDGWTRTIFSVTFKANDPITRIVLSGGKLVEA